MNISIFYHLTHIKVFYYLHFESEVVDKYIFMTFIKA